MSEEFNPYLKWLGIPLKHQPANHYRLLGLEAFEADPDVIESAADRQMSHVRTFRTGKRVETAEKVLNELSEARVVLLHAQKKAAYDEQLRAKQQELERQDAANNNQAPPMPRAQAAPAPPRAAAAIVAANTPPLARAVEAGPKVVGQSSSTANRARRRQQPPWVALGALGAVALIALVAGALALPGLLAEPSPPVADASDSTADAEAGTGSSTNDTTIGSSNTTSPDPSARIERNTSGSGNTKNSNPPRSNPGDRNTDNGNPVGSGNDGPVRQEPPDNRRQPPVDTRDPFDNSDGSADPDDEPSEPADDNPDDRLSRTGELTELINNPDKPPRRPPVDNFPSTKPAKIAAPSAASQATVEAKVKELYPLGNKPTIDQQRQTAKKLIDDGTAVKDSSDERFVMIRMGAEMAAAAGQLSEAMAAVDAIDHEFEGDTIELRLKMVEQALLATLPPEEKLAVFQATLPVLDAAIAGNKFAEVDGATATLLAAARKLNNKELSQALVERRKSAAALAVQYAKAKDALETLKDSPDDPAANLVVGSFFAFAKDEWEKGLAHLAKGSDAALADLAERELQPPAGNDLAKLADDWYARAQKEDQPVKGAMLARAEQHYQKALPDVTGLVKAGIEKRLAELASAAAATRPKQPLSPLARIVAVGDSDFEMYLNGQFLLRGGGREGELKEVTHELKSGDILTVKSTNRRDEKGFACVIKWEQGDRAIATGVTPLWQTYLPGNLQTWYDPAGIKLASPPQLGDTTRHQEVINATGIRCQPIWGPIPFAATFALRIP